MSDRYRPDPEFGNLHVCEDCTEANRRRLAERQPQTIDRAQDPTVRIVDTATHDRHHTEMAAAADPTQGVLL